MDGFYWLVEDRLAGSPRPFDHRDLDAWRKLGIRAVISLTETLPELGDLETLHLPVPDMTAPTIAQLQVASRFIDEQFAAGRPVVVHCWAGKGRTGTVLAAWLIGQGTTASEAIRAVRALSPGSIETREQERALVALDEVLSGAKRPMPSV